MIRILLVLLTVLLFNVNSNAQLKDIKVDVKNNPDAYKVEEDTIKKEVQKTDIIYQHDSTILYVIVKKIYLNDLYYSLPGENKVNKMDQRLVHKIEYSTGKIEILNETPPDIREVGDYRKVKVTENPDDVDGLIEVAKLEAKAEGSDRGYSTPKSLDRTAVIILRRKAALINANIILITERKSNVAFGEIPSVTLQGIAYSYR